MSTDTFELEPAYDFPTDGSSVVLHKGTVEMRTDGTIYRGDGKLQMEFAPRPCIKLHGSFEDVPLTTNLQIVSGKGTSSSIMFCGHPVECLLSGLASDAETPQKANLNWLLHSSSPLWLGDASTQMTRIVFHLLNFANIFGVRSSSEENGETLHRINHLDLIGSDWRVKLKSLASTDATIKVLQNEGGYGLTHVGCIQRANGAPFSGKEAEEFINALGHFFSFAKGGWCEPICPVGFDDGGTVVWELLSTPREPWNYYLSWCDPHDCSELPALFPGFMAKWSDDNWGPAFRNAIYWYVTGNDASRGTEVGLILTQAAIERLSYEYAVKDKCLLTEKGFNDIWASDKFRLLCSSIDIPLDIPPETASLLNLQSQLNWLDAPHALTDIRNALVHPNHKHLARFSGLPSADAWNLGQRLLELIILRLCDYHGTYGNRLDMNRWRGTTETVPWDASST